MKKQRGFSLLEVIISMGVLMLITFVIAAFQKDVFSYNSIFTNGLLGNGEARKALKTMSGEIRVASQASTGAFALEQTASTTFIFYSDVDGDALKERVRYFLATTTLRRGIIKPTGNPLTYNAVNEKISDLVHEIRNGTTSLFSYYDTNYDGTSAALTEPVTLSSVRLVKITIVIDQAVLRPRNPLTLTTQISLRNLKDNL